MILWALLAAQALNAADLRPTGFEVAGIRQGMTLSEYSALVSSGGFKSESPWPDTFMATIYDQEVTVTFCQGKVIAVDASYPASGWMKAFHEIESRGFARKSPSPTIMRVMPMVYEMRFDFTPPSGFAYSITPNVGTVSFRNANDVTRFNLRFQALANPCR